MKLLSNAVALLTLEPKMTKDKFLQGCADAKVRKKGQSLILAGTSEVLSRNSTAERVLKGFCATQSTKKGILTYY
jgi:23S rRNA maturation mini-RNase III